MSWKLFSKKILNAHRKNKQVVVRANDTHELKR